MQVINSNWRLNKTRSAHLLRFISKLRIKMIFVNFRTDFRVFSKLKLFQTIYSSASFDPGILEMFLIIIQFCFLRVFESLSFFSIVAVEACYDVTDVIVNIQRLSINFISFRIITRLSYSLHQLVFSPSNSVFPVICSSELTLIFGRYSSDLDGHFVYFFMVFVIYHWF